VYRDPSHNANGNTLDPGGHLVTCEHGTRVVSVTEPALGGERRVLVETFDHDGKPTKFNSPNDVVPGPDDSLYFTDPYWGLPFRERHQFQEYGNDNCWVFRIDNAGKATPIIKEMKRPNGLAFSPDRKTLYVADDEIKHIKAFAVAADGSVSGGRVFCEIDQGVPDGIRVDREGRLYSTAADGVHVFLPDGTRIGKLLCPEGPANCEFGGADGKTLFLTAKTGLYAIDLLVPGDGRGS
jgi:gluconolactonase